MNEVDFDITRAATSLLAGGVLHRYAEIRFIPPHSGRTMPVLAGRIKDRCPNDRKHAEYIPNGVYAELQKFTSISRTRRSRCRWPRAESPEPIESAVDPLPASGLRPDVMSRD